MVLRVVPARVWPLMCWLTLLFLPSLLAGVAFMEPIFGGETDLSVCDRNRLALHWLGSRGESYVWGEGAFRN